MDSRVHVEQVAVHSCDEQEGCSCRPAKCWAGAGDGRWVVLGRWGAPQWLNAFRASSTLLLWWAGEVLLQSNHMLLRSCQAAGSPAGEGMPTRRFCSALCVQSDDV